jgi:ribokinase
MQAALPGAGCVLVSTEIPAAAVAAAVRAATAAGVPCVLNAAPPIPVVLELLEHGPLLSPNARELAALHAMLVGAAEPGAAKPDAGVVAGEPNMAAQAVALASRTGAPVIVTIGGDGALIATADGAARRIPAPAADVVDTTGAGDTFNGVLAERLAAGDELADAVAVAVVAAALSVSHPGARTGMPDADAIRAALDAQLTGHGSAR